MTAHDPRVTLTEAEREVIDFKLLALAQIGERRFEQTFHWSAARIHADIEQIIAARLDRVRAVAEQWDTGCAREVLAALDAPQDAPRGPVGGEQGAEVTGGHGDGERAGEGDWSGRDWTGDRSYYYADEEGQR